MPDFPWALVTFDIDGTLTIGHGWAHLADAFGRRSQYDETNRRYLAGAVGEDEQLANLLALAEGRTLEEVGAALESTPKIEGIGESISAIHEHGARAALLTHNPAFVCEWYVKRFGFDDFEGTTTPATVGGKIPPSGPVRADKRRSLERLLGRAGAPAARTVHVGDSRADAAIFPLIGGGVALNSRIESVRTAADAVIDTADLRDLLPLLGHLRPRE
ncbi:MAG: HAD family hydrolase [Thermoplasmata archaeon]